jgi:hypothetical protein
VVSLVSLPSLTPSYQQIQYRTVFYRLLFVDCPLWYFLAFARPRACCGGGSQLIMSSLRSDVACGRGMEMFDVLVERPPFADLLGHPLQVRRRHLDPYHESLLPFLG